MATLDNLQQITEDFIEEYTSKQGQLPDWFEMITKTLSSRNITLEDWNRLQQYLKNVVAENETLFNFCKILTEVLTNLNIKVDPDPDTIYYLDENDLTNDYTQCYVDTTKSSICIFDIGALSHLISDDVVNVVFNMKVGDTIIFKQFTSGNPNGFNIEIIIPDGIGDKEGFGFLKASNVMITQVLDTFDSNTIVLSYDGALNNSVNGFIVKVKHSDYGYDYAEIEEFIFGEK